MNDHFSIARFGKYYVYDLKRCLSHVGLATLLASLSGVLLYIVSNIYFILLNDWDEFSLSTSFRNGVFMVTATIFMIIIASRLYGGITDKRTGTSYLMLPASKEEKFLSMMLNVLVAFPLAFSAIYWFGDVLICLMDNRLGDSIPLWSNMFVNLTTIDFFAKDSADSAKLALSIAMVLGIVCNQLEFLLGGMLFKRHKISKTILCLIGIGILMTMILIPVTSNIFKAENVFGADYDISMEAFSWGAAALQLLIDVLWGLLCWLRFKSIKH